MIQLHFDGGPFMYLLNLIGVVMLTLSFIHSRSIFSKKIGNGISKKLVLIKETGLLAMVVGVLATSLGLSDIFSLISEYGDLSLALIATGLRAAIIATIYGFMIYAFSIVIWLFLSWKLEQ